MDSANHKWFKIGLQLGIPHHVLEANEKKEYPLSAIINYWLKENPTEPYVPIEWKSIVEALKLVEEAALANEISKECCLQEDSEVDEGKKQSLSCISHVR